MALLFGNRVSKDVAERIEYRSQKLPTEANWIMFLFDWESALNPYIENSFGCFSWIQFCPDVPGGNYKTIQGRRYYFDEIKKWSPVQLVDLSFDYLEEIQDTVGRYSSYHDLYFGIFYPDAVGKPDDYVINTQTNPIFDLNKNGIITVGEVKAYLDNRVREKVPSAFWPEFFKKKTFSSSTKERSLSGELSLC